MSESHGGEGESSSSSSDTAESPESAECSSGEQSAESLESKISSSAKETSAPPAKKTSQKKGKRTLDGSVAIICYEDQKNHELTEFYFERKPQDYAIPKYRGKLGLVGGTIETTDKNSLEALVREFREEVADTKAQEILIKHLRAHPRVYTEIKETVNGKTATTYVYAITITAKAEWDIVKNSKLTDDAGPSCVYSRAQVLGLSDDDFAFYMGGAVKNFIKEYGEKCSKSAGTNPAKHLHTAALPAFSAVYDTIHHTLLANLKGTFAKLYTAYDTVRHENIFSTIFFPFANIQFSY